jgi:hypothetical protein
VSSLARSALWYARHGWRVFPVVARKKLPQIKRWPELATVDLVQVERWWREWPDANIGLACGPASGLYVVDVDQHGIDGEASLADLERKLGPLPPTVEQRTGSGGRQLFFAWPGDRDLRNKAGRPARGRSEEFQLPEGVDTRGEGGFVVVPPSVHPCGDIYRWTSGPHQADPAHLPEPWIRALERRRFTVTVPITPFRVVTDPTAIDRLAEHVARQAKGNRNSALYWAGRKLQQLRALGLVRDDDDRPLVAAALRAGLTEREARATLASSRRAGGGQ